MRARFDGCAFDGEPRELVPRSAPTRTATGSEEELCMRDSRPHHVAAALLLFLAAATPRPASAQLPEDRRTLTRPVSYAEMAAFLSSVNGKDPVTTSVEATTSGGRSVYLYGVYTDPRFRKLVTPGAAVPVWRVVMP